MNYVYLALAMSGLLFIGYLVEGRPPNSPLPDGTKYLGMSAQCWGQQLPSSENAIKILTWLKNHGFNFIHIQQIAHKTWDTLPHVKFWLPKIKQVGLKYALDVHESPKELPRTTNFAIEQFDRTYDYGMSVYPEGLVFVVATKELDHWDARAQ